MGNTRCKIRTTAQLKTGMVVRADGVDTELTRLDVYREVAKVEHFAYSDKIVTFTDGTRVRVGKTREFEVTRSKAARNTAKARVDHPKHPSALESALALLGAYVAEAVSAR